MGIGLMMEAGGVDLSNVKNLVFVKGASGAVDGTVSLKTGDIVQAKVVAASENSIILNIGGSRIAASTNLPLKSGDAISLMVIEVTPEKLVLKLLTDQSATPFPPKYTKNFIHLPLPVRLGDEMRTADIRIYRDGSGGKQRADQKSFAIVFALDMPAIGKTRAWIEVIDKFINFSITTESREAMEETKSMFGELERSFNELGYTVGRLSAIDVKEESLKSLIEEKIGLKMEGIDFKA